MAARPHCSTKLDGVVVVSKKWSVMNKKEHFKLYPSLKGSYLGKHQFKGVNFEEENAEILVGSAAEDLMADQDSSEAFFIATVPDVVKKFKVPLGKYQDFAVSFVILSSENILEGLGLKVLKMFYEIINSKRSNSEYPQDFCWGLTESSKLIDKNFVRDVGNAVMLKIAREIPCCKAVFLVFACLGQSCDFDLLKETLAYFVLKHINKLVVHCAFDFKQRGKSLFYNRRLLHEWAKNQNTKLQSEFYVCLLKGVGNFYFGLNGIGIEGNRSMKFIEAKFYSEAFKTMHQSSSIRFKEEDFCYMLMDPRNFAGDFVTKHLCQNFKSKLENLECVQNVLDSYGSLIKTLTARFEVIVRLEGEHNIREAGEIVPNIIKKKLNLEEVESCLEAFCTEKLGNHLKMNLNPFLATMRNYLIKRIELNNRLITKEDSDDRIAPPVIFDPQMFLNCIAAEAVVAITLYGNAYWKPGKGHLYPKWLIEGLGIEKYKFRNPVQGPEEKWLISAVRNEQGESITFDFPQFDVKNLLKKIEERCGITKRCLGPLFSLSEVTQKNGIASDATVVPIDEVAKLLVETLIEISVKRFIKIRRKFLTQSIAEKLLMLREVACPDSNSILMESSTLVDKIFAGEIKCLYFVTWLAGIGNFIVNDDGIMLKTATKKFLELQLYQVCKILPIPRGLIGQEQFAVVPFGAAYFNGGFLSLSFEQQDILAREYHLVYPVTMLEDIADLLKKDWIDLESLFLELDCTHLLLQKYERCDTDFM